MRGMRGRKGRADNYSKLIEVAYGWRAVHIYL